MSLLSADQPPTKNSYYAATALRDRRHEALQSDAECDVAVVGGGLAGLSAAIELADSNFALDYFRLTVDLRLLYSGDVSDSTNTPTNLAADGWRAWPTTG